MFVLLSSLSAASNAMSNRTPTKKEVDQNIHYLKTLIDMFKPKTVIAIGRKAESALLRLGVGHSYVRHPAQGGQKEFVSGIKKIYGLV